VFPNVLGRGLRGYRFQGYWVDCGTPESYLRAQSELLDHGRSLYRPAITENTEVVGMNYLDGTSLRSCTIRPYVCALPGSSVAEGSTVERSVLMEGAAVGKGCRVRDCLLGPGVSVKDGGSIEGKVLASSQ
jgi:mannose-1-phosphate guanylyltransferase